MAGLGELHERLHGRLWHTTRPDRVPAIIEMGALMAEPNIPDSERYNTRCGPKGYPLVRSIGGVSLFDFHEFDAEAYSLRCPSSSWPYFVPHAREGAVWIEIDRTTIGAGFIAAAEVLRRRGEGDFGRNVMPYIEAAFIGDLPVAAFRAAFLTWDRGRQVREFAVPHFDRQHYDALLREWRAACAGG